MRILVSGYNGFLAKSLRNLFSPEDVVVGLVRNIESCCTDLLYNSLDDLFLKEESFDVIFHLASVIPYPSRKVTTEEIFLNNVDLTEKLIRRYNSSRFVFASSVSVYGSHHNGILSVNSKVNPENTYADSKLFGEEFVKKNCENYVILRFSSIIGPKMKPYSFIPIIIQEAMDKQKIVLFGDGSRKQNYIDVRDAARMLFYLGLSSNIVSTELGVGTTSYSNLEVANIVAKQTGACINFFGNDESSSFIFEPSHGLKQLGFKYYFNLERTIKDIIE